MARPSCSPTSDYITRKEIAAVAEISEDTLKRADHLGNVRKAIEDARDPLCEKPIRCHRAKLRTRLSLYGHEDPAARELAEKLATPDPSAIAH